MLYTYDDSQLAEIRKIIAGLARLTPDDIAVRDTAVADGKCSVALWPLWPLALTDPALWSTVVADDRIGEFSVYGLFPAAYDIVYGDYHQATEVRYDGRTRGSVAIISGRSGGESASVVIKPRQSQREAEIAGHRGRAGCRAQAAAHHRRFHHRGVCGRDIPHRPCAGVGKSGADAQNWSRAG